MHSKILRTLGAFVVLTWSFAPGYSKAAASCATSVASLQGWYSLVITGGNLATGTAKYQAGAVLFNGAGKLSGTHVYGSGGQPVGVSGTYAANTDCTLTLSMTIGAAAPAAFTVAVKGSGEAVGIEVDATAVANITLKPQYGAYVSALNFNSSSLNSAIAASCSGPLSASSDLNLATFKNGSVSGTDPYNNGGSFAVANVPYTGTYTVNSDGTFAGSLSVVGTPFAFYGVIGSKNTEIDYIYANVSNGAATDAFAACFGGTAASPYTAVNLAPYFNASVADSVGTATANGGFDGSGYAYAANLLGSSVIWHGLSFGIGPANGANAVSATTITLPAGSFSTLDVLAAAAYGQKSGTFVVTYTDGSKATFTQTVDDWGLYVNGAPAPLSTGESIAAAMAYRLGPTGVSAGGPYYLYGYSFALDKTKTVSSLTLPATAGIRTLSAVLEP